MLVTEGWAADAMERAGFDCYHNFLRFKVGPDLPSRARLDLIKATGVLSQDHGLMIVFQITSFENFIDLFHAVIQCYLVRKIRGEHKRLRTGSFDGVPQRLFIPFATYEDPAAAEVFFGFFLQP